MSILGALLIVLAIFLTIGGGVNAGSMHSSDAAGNGMAQGFALVLSIADWVVLTVLLLICAARDGFPHYSGFAMLVAFGAAIAGQITAFAVLSNQNFQGASATALAAITVAAPGLVIARATWGIFPAVRNVVPELAGSWLPIVLLAIVALVPFSFLPAHLARKAASEADAQAFRREAEKENERRKEQRVDEELARIAALGADSNLYSAIPFCADPEAAVRDAARAKARTFTRRQADAQQYLAGGHDATLRELPNFDLTATPTLCANARKILASKAAAQPFDSDPIRIEDAEREVAPYVGTMQWLLANGCDCKPELASLKQAVLRFAPSKRREKLLADLDRV